MSGCAPDDGDEHGGLAAPQAPPPFATTCKRCGQPAVLAARGTTHCRACFLGSLRTRFTKALTGPKLAARDGLAHHERQLLGYPAAKSAPRNRTAPKRPLVVACSGGPASAALVHLAHRALFASGNEEGEGRRGDRYAHAQPFDRIEVVYVDESAAPGFATEDRTDEVRELVRSISPDLAFTALRLEDVFAPSDSDSTLPVSIASPDLPLPAARGTDPPPPRPSRSPRDRLRAFLSLAVHTPTALASLQRSLISDLVLAHARALDAEVLLLGETGTRTAVRILAGMSEGRGDSVGEEVAAEYVSRLGTGAGPGPGDEEQEQEQEDDDGRPVLVVRPLAQVVAKEVAFYNREMQVESVVVVNRETSVRPQGEPGAVSTAPGGEVSAKTRSIPGLVEDFVLTLDADFPSTVPTVVRTAHKLGLRSSHATFLALAREAEASGPAGDAASDTEGGERTLCPLCGLPARPRADEWRKAITVSDLQAALALEPGVGAGTGPAPGAGGEQPETSGSGTAGKGRARRAPYRPSEEYLLVAAAEAHASAPLPTTSASPTAADARSEPEAQAQQVPVSEHEPKSERAETTVPTLARYLCYGCLLVLSEPASSAASRPAALRLKQQKQKQRARLAAAAAKRKEGDHGTGPGEHEEEQEEEEEVMILPPFVGAAYDTMEECLASMRPSDELMELLFGEEQGYRQLIEHFEGFEAGGGRGRGKARGASRDQRGGMTGYDSHKLRSEERPLAHDHERLREPSVAYRMIADEEPATAAADELKDLKPLIVCLPLNGVLLHRAQRTTRGSFAPVKRPYLAAFLEYLFAPAHRDSAEVKSDDKGRKIHVVVYTATRAHNVVTLLDGLDLTPSSRATSLAGTPYVVDPAKGDILKLVLSREDLDLGDDYKENVRTIKDLRKVWEKLGIAEDDGARRTVLLTDDPIDASAQPHSRLAIPTFKPKLTQDDDSALLEVICKLDELASQKNIPAYSRAQGTAQQVPAGSAAGTSSARTGLSGSARPVPGASRKSQAESICKSLGTDEVRAAPDPRWLEKVTAR
ncbi:Cytoplasmic tRNA 2-thiolation protein 2 [Rhodotorula sphaerocarpa]